jgi:hypothetical protein
VHQSEGTHIVSDQKALEVQFVPPVVVLVGSFATEDTTPMTDIRALSLISERAVNGHWEENVVIECHHLVLNTYTIDNEPRSHAQIWIVIIST